MCVKLYVIRNGDGVGVGGATGWNVVEVLVVVRCGVVQCGFVPGCMHVGGGVGIAISKQNM